MKVINNAPHSPQLIEKAKTSERSQEAGHSAAKSGLDSSKAAGGGRSGANVEISDRAKLMQQATDLAKASPDVRAEKVAALKKSIQDGTYKVDSQAVADKLVDEH